MRMLFGIAMLCVFAFAIYSGIHHEWKDAQLAGFVWGCGFLFNTLRPKRR